MNVHDSEHVAGVLINNGYEPAAEQDDADIIIFNTCCVRQSAEDRVWGNLGALAHEGGRRRIVCVCGCMAEKHGSGIMTRAPGVNLVFGMAALDRLPGLIGAAMLTHVCDLGDVSQARIDCLPAARDSKYQAWVPVSHGCDNNCSYCVVPAVRGADRSRLENEVVSEVEGLASQGVVEVILLGQNVNSYGRDLEPASSFARLLRQVADVDGIRRVKYETSHPRDLTDDILEVMGGSDKICEYLHLPVQSGSDRILHMMNRGYGRDYVMELAARAREKIPGLTLTTDIIVGFPGETDKDFSETMRLVEEVQFDTGYLFLYSSREGTPAADMSGTIPDNIKRRRFKKLAELQGEITAGSLKKVVGMEAEVLIEGPSKRGAFLAGRTRGHTVVHVPIEPLESPLVRVHVDAAGKHSLRGSILR